MQIPSIHQLMDILTWSSTGLSLLYSILPTVETFNNFPRFQRHYIVFLSVLQQLGSNLRHVFYPQIKKFGAAEADKSSKV